MFFLFEQMRIPDGVTVTLDKNKLILKKGEKIVSFPVVHCLDVSLIFNTLKIGYSIKKIERRQRRVLLSSLYTYKKKIENFLFGFSLGYVTLVQVEGVGYKASVIDSSTLELKVGYSHPIHINIPQDVSVSCPKETVLLLRSFSKDLLSNFVSKIESCRTPGVYDNKGILIKGKPLLKKKLKKK